MSIAAHEIAKLDRQIAKKGQDVVLRRVVEDGDPVEAPHRAFSRGYRPDELSGGIQQNVSTLVMSPTNMPAAFATDETMISAGDRVVMRGRTRVIQNVDVVEMNGVVVRYNLTIGG